MKLGKLRIWKEQCNFYYVLRNQRIFSFLVFYRAYITTFNAPLQKGYQIWSWGNRYAKFSQNTSTVMEWKVSSIIFLFLYFCKLLCFLPPFDFVVLVVFEFYDKQSQLKFFMYAPFNGKGPLIYKSILVNDILSSSNCSFWGPQVYVIRVFSNRPY